MSAKATSPGVVAFLEEVFRTAKGLSLSAWAIYFGATTPFVLAFLYFWGDMANDAFAYQRLGASAFVLAALFVVTKTGHAVFARSVLAHVTGDFDAPRPRVGRILVNQTILQSTGLLTLPLCLFVIAPFGYAYAMYQSATVLDDGSRGLRELIGDARRQAGLNQAQNNYMLWLICPYAVGVAAIFFLLVMPVMRMFTPEWSDLVIFLYAIIVGIAVTPLCPFGMVVALNIAAALLALPALLHTLFGIETPFTVSAMGAINPTFFVIVVALTYLCLDPLIKVAYTLRCFYGDSRRTGKDLRIKLERIAALGAMLVLCGVALGGLTGTAVYAQESGDGQIDEVTALDRAIDETLLDRRFTWREPRERPEAFQSGFAHTVLESIRDAVEWVRDVLKSIWEWLKSLLPDGRDRRAPSGVSSGALRAMAGGLLVVLLGLLAYVAWRTWRGNKVVEVDALDATPVVPDLEDESTTADALASDEWLNLAAELMSRGEFRLAMRAYFFAGLARLSQQRLIRVASYKSNREYDMELQRVAHAREDLVAAFRAGMKSFEAVWYGNHTLPHEDLRSFVESQRWISHCE